MRKANEQMVPRRVAITRARQRGVALIAVLWLVVLLSLIAASFLSQTGTEARLTANLRGAAEARAAADGAIYLTLWGALNRMTPEEAGLIPQPAEGNELPGTRRYSTQIGGTLVTMVIEVESAKLDLNAANEEGFMELFLALGFDSRKSQSLTEAILDYRDEDNEPRMLGAEDPAYRAAERPWGAKDSNFAALEELQQVMGVTPGIYTVLEPYVSVASGSRRISRELQEILGITQGTASSDLMNDEIDEQRYEESGILSGRRLIYAVRATAITDTGGRFQRHAVIRPARKRNGFGIIEWRQKPVTMKQRILR